MPEILSLGIKEIKERIQVSYPNHETQTPHITIYSCKFDASKIVELIQRIKDIKLKSFSLKLGDVTFKKLNKGSKNYFASIGLEDSASLTELHEKILSVANELRGDLIRAKDIERFNKGIYSSELFSFIKKYGYEHVRENFHPHITLGEIGEGQEDKIDQIKALSKSFTGREFEIKNINLILSTRLVPSEKKTKESENIIIELEP